jgi:hypothetical protein
MTASPRVLDPCCGSRMFYINKSHPDVLFGDKRSETLTVTDRTRGDHDGTRTLHIAPDMLMDFTAMPFADRTFNLVVFDPPHLKRAGPRSWLAAKYGKLPTDWQAELTSGFAECFRVLAAHGTLIFKWNETQISLRDVLQCTPVEPLFANKAGKAALTHWVVFIKPLEATS